jgi:hypothetical protein
VWTLYAHAQVFQTNVATNNLRSLIVHHARTNNLRLACFPTLINYNGSRVFVLWRNFFCDIHNHFVSHCFPQCLRFFDLEIIHGRSCIHRPCRNHRRCSSHPYLLLLRIHTKWQSCWPTNHCSAKTYSKEIKDTHVCAHTHTCAHFYDYPYDTWCKQNLKQVLGCTCVQTLHGQYLRQAKFWCNAINLDCNASCDNLVCGIWAQFGLQNMMSQQKKCHESKIVQQQSYNMYAPLEAL